MKPTDFARYLSAFLGTYLPGVRNVSTNTIRSYRDTYRLLFLFCTTELNIPVEKLSLGVLTENTVLRFLGWLEQDRGNSVATRNQRLAAIHALFRYVQLEEPVLLDDCQKILSIPFKKCRKSTVNHLSTEALQLILRQPDITCRRGRRDLIILSLLYDTGARVQELVDLRARDIRLTEPPVVSLTGKGRKTRHVPLLRRTRDMLEEYLQEWRLTDPHSKDTPLFINYQGKKMTRAGISYIVRKYATMAKAHSKIVPDTVTPHVFRHTKAMHLYQAGVNLIYIRDLLGHVNISSTDIYARADTEMKRKALEKVYPNITNTTLPDWRKNEDLLAWLNRL